MGAGIPLGRDGSELSLEARTFTVCDIFDAITDDRPCRGPVPVPEALEIMERLVGTALDPDCFQALTESVDDVGHEADDRKVYCPLFACFGSHHKGKASARSRSSGPFVLVSAWGFVTGKGC